MRYIKLLLLAVSFGFILASCEEGIDHPEVGNVKVSFSYLLEQNEDKTDRENGDTLSVRLSTNIISLMVETEQQDAEKGAYIEIDYENVIIKDKDGNKVEMNEYNFVPTEKHLYLPPYDVNRHGDNNPSKSFEIRLPDRKNYSSVEFTAVLKGNNAGAKNKMVVSLK